MQQDYTRVHSAAQTKKAVFKGFVYAFLIIWALIVLFPFYWMVLSSIKSYGDYNAEFIPQFIAKNPTFENYVSAFSAVPLADYFVNTVIFTLFLSLMMIPSELVVITNFVTVTNLNMRNTFIGLILPSVASVFYIYLLKENFAQVPDELYYAAKVDGTSDLKYLWKVMIPICKPTVITIAILKVIECWNSYVWPRLITDDPNYFLVSNGIQEIRENGFGRENIPAMMAAVVVISVPLIVLFLIFRKKIMTGVARGGTKG